MLKGGVMSAIERARSLGLDFGGALAFYFNVFKWAVGFLVLACLLGRWSNGHML